jgi:hypothetical protein
MPEPLTVDPFYLEQAGADLLGQVLPTAPPPLTAEGADAMSTAINVTMPMIEAPVVEGLPATQAALNAVGSKIAAAARMYAETDQKLGQKLSQAQFSGIHEKAATPQLNSTYSPPLGSPMPKAGPATQQPPAPHEAAPSSTALNTVGDGLTNTGVSGDGLTPSGATGFGAGLDEPFSPPVSTFPSDPSGSEGGIKPASVDPESDLEMPGGPDGADQAANPDTNPDGSTDPSSQDGSDGSSSPDGTGGAPPEGTTQSPSEGEDGSQNPAPVGGPKATTPEQGQNAATPKEEKESTTKSAPAKTVPPTAQPGGRGLFSAPQAGTGTSGRGIPPSLAGAPKPTTVPHQPAATHVPAGHHPPPVSPSSGTGRPLHPPAGVPVAGHPAPLSPAAPAVPLGPTSPETPHNPAVATATPPSPAAATGGGGPGPGSAPPAPAAPTSMPVQSASPAISPAAADPPTDTGQKPSGGSLAGPQVPRTREALMASIPVSPARAERDAIAEAATADAARRDGPDPLLLAVRIAAALNAPDPEGQDDFGFFWVTAVTTDGEIVVANSFGIAYIPEGVQLPELVIMASADDEIPVVERAGWVTYPVPAVQRWADHHDLTLRAIVATEEQLAATNPGVEKIVLQDDDLPDAGEMIGRSRLEVVNPQAAEWLAAIPDEDLLDRLPKPAQEADPEAPAPFMLWMDVMGPLLSDADGRDLLHLQAFHTYASHAEQLGLREAHTRPDPVTRRPAVADWLYWRHLRTLHDAVLNDPIYVQRIAAFYADTNPDY